MFSEIAEIALVAVRRGQFLQFLQFQVILILNFTRPHAITHTNYTTAEWERLAKTKPWSVWEGRHRISFSFLSSSRENHCYWFNLRRTKWSFYCFVNVQSVRVVHRGTGKLNGSFIDHVIAMLIIVKDVTNNWLPETEGNAKVRQHWRF